MRVHVVRLGQDDPKKCTAEKLVKFGLAKDVKKTLKGTLILNPFAQRLLLGKDRKRVNSITAIDCSWTQAGQTFAKEKYAGVQRRLPPLLAGNPVNYSKLNKLTTVEAIAGAAFIFGYEDLAQRLLDKFKWGHTFYELNRDLLEDYAGIKSEEDVDLVLKEYGILY